KQCLIQHTTQIAPIENQPASTAGRHSRSRTVSATAAMPFATAAPRSEITENWRRTRELRAAMRVPCRLRSTDSQTGGVLLATGETVNLSNNGLAVQLGRDIPTGTNVEVLVS